MTCPVAMAGEREARFEWEAGTSTTGEPLTYTVWFTNAATGDSTFVTEFPDNGASDYAATFMLQSGEIYDVTVRGWIADGTDDSCTRRIEVPGVHMGGCSCALID